MAETLIQTPNPKPRPEEDSRPPSEEALALARKLARDFRECMWFRHPEATIETRDDIYVVIAHLREYGGHKAWRAAQDLWSCL